MNVSSVGETTIFIRAEAKDYAPRLVPLRVRRVHNLREEARRIAGKATSSYSSIVKDLGTKRDLEVMLKGKITEVRTTNHTTVLVLDVESGCLQSPCLARAFLGAKIAAARGDDLAVFGRVVGRVDFAGKQIPEVRADFVLSGSSP
jgi:hypothetical protein